MRLLSLAPSSTEILFTLGLDDQIIGTTRYCDYPKEANFTPKVGSWIRTDPERIKALRPDLIFTSYFLPEPLRDWSGPGEVIHVTPKTLSDVKESFITIARATKKLRAAQKLLAAMDNHFDKIRRAQPSTKPRVYMEEWPFPPMVSGNWVPELVEIAGGNPIIAKTGKPSAEFAFTKLKKEDPDIMIFHWCGYGERWSKDMIKKRKGWDLLRAAQTNNLYVIYDSLLNRPGPRLIQGAQRIQNIFNSILKV